MKIKNLATLFCVGTLSGVLAAIIVKDYINSKDSFGNKSLYFPKFGNTFDNHFVDPFGNSFGNLKKPVSETEDL